MKDVQPALDLFSGQGGDTDQFKLVKIQTFNWGTFPGVFDFPIPERGYLFVGNSGSGKSTVLDANAALMTPPRWVDFNVAAREAERGGKDRNILTYVRGAWAQQTAENGEYASQYLRPDTTWTAIAQTYRDGHGRIVVLAQVLWIRGKSTTPSDVKRYYLVLEREFDVRELKFLPDHDFDVRRFKFDLPEAFANTEFSVYQERFRRLLGIESERALRLLHKTQSAKNLGELNTFLRDFMLDQPETFELSDKLVSQFKELKGAHDAVVEARRQIETLKPAQAEATELDSAKLVKNALEELQVGVDKYREQRRKSLLEAALRESQTELDGMAQEATRLASLTDNEFLTLRALQDRRAGMGGSLLERLAGQLKEAEGQREHRIRKRDVAHAACAVMGWTPPDEAVWFTQRRDAAVQYQLDISAKTEAMDEKKRTLWSAQADATKVFERAKFEVAALERQPSNIPGHMLALREKISRALGIPEEKLPFVGELLEVKQEEEAWQGAIERVLNAFAQSLLVDDRHYTEVSSYLNDTFLDARLVYYRVVSQVAAQRTVGPNSLVKKLNFAHVPHADWVREELKVHFDYECAETVHSFRSASRAITKEGQVKHNATRHEKNDRVRVDDRSKWVLGFDNAAKLELFKRQAFDAVVEMERLKKELADLTEESLREQERMAACIKLANLTWEEVDVGSSLALIAALQAQIQAEQEARPDLARLDEDIERQKKAHAGAVKRQSEFDGGVAAERMRLKGLESRLSTLKTELLSVALTPHQQAGLDNRFQKYSADIGMENLDSATTQVIRALNLEERNLIEQMTQLKVSIERRFADFIRAWAAEAGGLDATLASAPDFFAKLARLESDNLPKFEARFLEMLREHSDQNLTRLSTQLDQERKAIRDRMTLVNESLATAPFSKGTYLVIETQEKLLPDVLEFKAKLKEALSHTLSSDPELAERRFEAINALVKRLGSQETADRNWRSLVLDVRQHVEFIARELDADGVEVEVYRSGAGKSGGQRQKLAATCLAAALRYQLGGQDRALPRFSTVFLDEAFDKADAEFTAMAMNIFKTFGFQMIVATPMKSVMTLEPFIGGACYVHIKDRKTSHIVPIDYDESNGRLKLNPEDKHVEEVAAT